MRSEPFRLGRWKCYLLMVSEQAPWIGWIVAALAAGIAVAGFLVSPWMGIAALGFDAFLVTMALGFVIMAYGFNSITGANMPLHVLRIEGGRMVVEFEDGREAAVDLADCRPYKIYPGGVLVPVAGARAGWIWVSPKAFGTPEDFKAFMKEIYESHTE